MEMKETVWEVNAMAPGGKQKMKKKGKIGKVEVGKVEKLEKG